MLVRRLALVQEPDEGAQAVQPPRENTPDADPTLRVAIATRDGRAVNAHFGSAKRFVVYDVAATKARFVETILFDAVSDESGQHTHDGDDKNGAKIKALSGVGLLIVQAIGGPVAARVIRSGIHPVKFSHEEPIGEVIGEVQAMLTGKRLPWLRKVLQQGQTRDMKFLDDEE